MARIKPAIPQLARGVGTSDLWVVVLVLVGLEATVIQQTED